MRKPCPKPCAECPWRRESTRGWLGPFEVEDWVALAHGDDEIACHLTIDEGFDDLDVDSDEYHHQLDAMRECTGAATYRGNMGKRPRSGATTLPANRETIFASPVEFREHHTR